MNKRGHWILGIISSFVFILFIGWLNLNWFKFSFVSVLVMAGIILVYSILPDMDHESGTITWWFIGTATFGVLFGVFEMIFNKNYIPALNVFIFSALLLVLTFVATNFLEHRGIIHSVPAGIIFTVPLWFLFYDISYCILAYINFHSHLLGDGYLFKIK